MRPKQTWRQSLQRIVNFFAVTLAASCLMEVTVRGLEGERPKVRIPWGHEFATLIIAAIGLSALAWWTWPPSPFDDSTHSGDGPKTV